MPTSHTPRADKPATRSEAGGDGPFRTPGQVRECRHKLAIPRNDGSQLADCPCGAVAYGKHRHTVNPLMGEPHDLTCIDCGVVVGARQLHLGVDHTNRDSGLRCGACSEKHDERARSSAEAEAEAEAASSSKGSRRP